MEERNAFNLGHNPSQEQKRFQGQEWRQTVRYEETSRDRDRERGQGHPGFCQGHRDTGLQRMENQESQEGTEPGPRSSREEEAGGGKAEMDGAQRARASGGEAPDPSPPQRPAAASRGLWHPQGEHRREHEVSWIPCTLFRDGRTQLYPEEQSKSALWGFAQRSLVEREDTGGGGAPWSG